MTFAIKNRKNEIFNVSIDEYDIERVTKHKWYVGNTGYVVRNIKTENNERTLQSLHRFILNYTGKMDVDHIDGNPLNNRKSNLRICSHSQNGQNRGKNKNNTAGFKGVYWHKPLSKWCAKIYVNFKKIHLGYFEDKIEAAKAYNQAAIKYHGEYGYQNDLTSAKI